MNLEKLIKVIPSVLLILCVGFSEKATSQVQMLSDPGFEKSTPNGEFPDSGYWNPSGSDISAYAVCTKTAGRDGTNGLWEYTGNEGNAWWSRSYQEFRAMPGEIYSGSIWIRTPPDESWVQGSVACARIEFLNSSYVTIAWYNSSCITNANFDWAEYIVYSEPAPPETSYVRFIVSDPSTAPSAFNPAMT